MMFLLWSLAVLVFVSTTEGAFGGHDKYNDRMLLSEISALTLYHGKMTNGRRSAPVPQLKCVGGTAGCNQFIPQVVQCYNRGGDGYDVQWECKTDMDNAYRFGKVEVTCEGFDHPDDPYILRGSCGLEYTLDLTMEGHMHKQQKDHNYYGHNDYHDRSGYQSHGHYSKRASSIFSDLIILCIVGIIIYAIYKTCIADRSHDRPYDDPSFRSHDRGSRPPPPGFRSDYMPNDGGSCSSTYTGSSYGTNQGTQPTGGGFWTGAFTGGILGYLMGNRNNYYDGSYTYSQPYHRPYTTYQRPSWGWGGLFGGTRSNFTSGGGGFGGGTASASSGTRTASGFGGTRRR